jgi:hypothetical protein
MAGSPLSDPSWSASAADTVVRVVGEIRDRTTRRVVLAARGLVFGLIAVFGGLAMLVLSVIASTRALQALLEWPLDHPTAVWVSYLVLGGIFLVAGSLAMAQRHAGDAPEAGRS